MSVFKNGNYHSLPHITQPLLSKYRQIKKGNELVIEEQSGFLCSIFGNTNGHRMTLCKCERTEDGHCELVMRWINEYYNWKEDPKFVKAYQSYNRRNI